MRAPTVGDKVRERRLELAYTQGDLATYSGLSPARISQIECDWRGSVPTIRTLRIVAEALRCDWRDLATPEQIEEAS